MIIKIFRVANHLSILGNLMCAAHKAIKLQPREAEWPRLEILLILAFSRPWDCCIVPVHTKLVAISVDAPWKIKKIPTEHAKPMRKKETHNHGASSPSEGFFHRDVILWWILKSQDAMYFTALILMSPRSMFEDLPLPHLYCTFSTWSAWKCNIAFYFMIKCGGTRYQDPSQVLFCASCQKNLIHELQRCVWIHLKSYVPLTKLAIFLFIKTNTQ